MNERIKELAEQAGFDSESQTVWAFDNFDLERFAELIRADERDKWEQALPLAMDAMMLQERAACSDLIANMISGIEGVRYAEAIRQRGEK